jgi:hypothetical protein
VALFGLRANAEMVTKFHIPLLASHAALPMLATKFQPIVAVPTLGHTFHYNAELPTSYRKEFRAKALPLPDGRAGTAWEALKSDI